MLLLLSSCSNNSNGTIELNNGEKWQVNKEMMPPLNASQQLVTAYVSNGEKDYKTLAAQLKDNNKTLIASCTMKGKSHDELHKWLHPYMGLLDELDNAKSQEEAQAIVAKIQESFTTFNESFQ